jgi:hypothetical protein
MAGLTLGECSDGMGVLRVEHDEMQLQLGSRVLHMNDLSCDLCDGDSRLEEQQLGLQAVMVCLSSPRLRREEGYYLNGRMLDYDEKRCVLDDTTSVNRKEGMGGICKIKMSKLDQITYRSKEVTCPGRESS